MKTLRKMVKNQLIKMNKVQAKAAAVMLIILNGHKILLFCILKRKNQKCKMKQMKKIFWIKKKLNLNNRKNKANK